MNKFKVLLLAFLFFVFIVKNTFAQGNIGIKAGLNLAKTTFLHTPDGFDVSEPYYRAAFHAGIFWHIPFSKQWYVQPELIYSGKGNRTEGQTFDIPYLILPITIGYKPIASWQIEIGVELGYLLKDRKYYSDLDYGLDIGVLFSPLDKMRLGVRYALGLNNVLEDDITFTNNEGNPITGIKLNNRVLQFSLYYDVFNL